MLREDVGKFTRVSDVTGDFRDRDRAGIGVSVASDVDGQIAVVAGVPPGMVGGAQWCGLRMMPSAIKSEWEPISE